MSRHRLQYVAATSSAVIDMDGASVYTQGGAAGIRGRNWARELGYRDLLQANRPAREESLTVFMKPADADLFRKAADADVDARKPGTLVFDGVWKQAAYILESSVKPQYSGVIANLTVALMDGGWHQVVSKSFMPRGDVPTYEYLDYPHDFAFDYGPIPDPEEVDTGMFQPAPVRLTVYGPATNPYIVVGGNRYEVNTNVPAGGYLVVDGLKMTIEVVTQNGTVADVFSAGERGSGLGGGSYIFQPLPSGVLPVSWDGSFGFDLGWYDIETEPPWNRS